jgi:hypothetical protein
MRKGPAKVVDTNVPVVANGSAPQASESCARACCDELWKITSGRARLVVDDGFEIFAEYGRHLSLRGQPGVGDMFLKWVHDHQFNPQRCVRVALTPHPERVYVQFPEDPALTGFDPDDRKFAAVAAASPSPARILNAVDSDWWEFESVLARHGINVEFVCDDQIWLWRRGHRQRG